MPQRRRVAFRAGARALNPDPSRGRFGRGICGSDRHASGARGRLPGIGGGLRAGCVAWLLEHNPEGRHFSSWLGLVPKQRSTGGRQRLSRISREGNECSDNCW
jgi:hypothetical protein